MSRYRLMGRLFLAASTACAGLSATAFNINIPPVVTVVEYKNVGINHYFMTSSPAEQAAVDSGAAGPGWIRTGFGFLAYEYPLGQLAPVDRFHGTPGVGPNSHFFTANPWESAVLRNPGTGWDYEGPAFAIAVPRNGQCYEGATAVYRLYNRRWMFNDSNHRYVTSGTERSAMIAAGWIDEGAVFCSDGAVEVPLRTFAIEIPVEGGIRSSGECEDESIHLGSCLAINNLPVPATRRRNSASDLYALLPYTGWSIDDVYVPRPTATVEDVVRDVFAQVGSYIVGLHVDTRSRGPSMFSSMNPLYQFRTDAGSEARFFPWRTGLPFETQIAIAHGLNLERVTLRSPGSGLQGNPTVEFIDSRSGLHLYFVVLTYATSLPTQALHVSQNVATGKVTVATVHGVPSTPWGRNVGRTTLYPSSGYDSYSLPRLGGSFEFRIDRAEFQHILDAARAAAPALSADPGDYLVDNFHFNNAVYGDGEIGLNLSGMSLRLLRR